MAILCDSRGEFTILLVDLLSAGCEILESREGSDYPLVSSSTLIVKGKEQKEVMMAAIGDTAGEVCVWVIPVSKGKEEEREEGGYRKVVKYNAHAMGTNSVHLSALERRGQEYTRLLLCSGGDDQSITVCLLDFHAREEREEERVPLSLLPPPPSPISPSLSSPLSHYLFSLSVSMLYRFDFDGFCGGHERGERREERGEETLNTLLHTVFTGCTWSKATQDHRILSLSICMVGEVIVCMCVYLYICVCESVTSLV